MSPGTARVHLDTDLGSDTDDLCALAFLLGHPNVTLTGVTTNTDPGGVRAGFTSYALALAGRSDVAVRAGAEDSLSGLFAPLAFPDYWPEKIEPRPSRAGEAIELLEAAATAGDMIVAVGSYTNLAVLEAARPGLLASTRVVIMGGHVTTARPGLPPWGRDDDFNVQQDRFAAEIVLTRACPVVVPLAVSLEVWLRSVHIPRLRSAGPLGALIADQAEAHARDNARPELGVRFDALPDDLLNFQYDVLAAAAAVEWDGVTIEEMSVAIDLGASRLTMTRNENGHALAVATSVDRDKFDEVWLDAVERASSGIAEP